MTPCAVYCRVSTEKQKEKHTIEQLAGETFEVLPFHDARNLLTTCIKKISVYQSNAYLEYQFPVMSSGQNTKRLKF